MISNLKKAKQKKNKKQNKSKNKNKKKKTLVLVTTELAAYGQSTFFILLYFEYSIILTVLNST